MWLSGSTYLPFNLRPSIYFINGLDLFRWDSKLLLWKMNELNYRIKLFAVKNYPWTLFFKTFCNSRYVWPHKYFHASYLQQIHSVSVDWDFLAHFWIPNITDFEDFALVNSLLLNLFLYEIQEIVSESSNVREIYGKLNKAFRYGMCSTDIYLFCVCEFYVCRKSREKSDYKLYRYKTFGAANF